jgi:hypothetical protein
MIESVLKREGKVVDRWTRELLPDGKTMKIAQYGFAAMAASSKIEA